MSAVLVVILFVVVIFVLIRVLYFFQDRIGFFADGSEKKFTLKELSLLWKLSKECKLETPVSLFYSVESLDQCIAKVVEMHRDDGTIDDEKIQAFLSRLYDYRTKIELEAARKKGLASTRSLSQGQKLRIVLPGHGVFYSEIIGNARDIVISIPKQDGIIKQSGEQWVGSAITVYLWRKQDAGYVFDTVVTAAGSYNGQLCLNLAQTEKLLRTQKRRSVRAECQLVVALYPIRTDPIDYHAVEMDPGYRCILEDISEDGALIKIGGKGRANVQIKLQFSIDGTFIMMFGVVRSVDYDPKTNESRLHFECLHLEPNMRNAVLAYVYRVLPEDKKDMFTALSLTEEDAEADGNKNEIVQQLEAEHKQALAEKVDDILIQDEQESSNNSDAEDEQLSDIPNLELSE